MPEMTLEERIAETEKEIEAELKKLRRKSIDSMTDEEKGFVKARAYYLSGDELKKYESLLEPVKKK